MFLRSLLVGIAVFLCSSGFAQEVYYGFKLGLQSSTITNQDFTLVTDEGGMVESIPSEVSENRLGASAYFFAEIPISNSLSFQPEIGFAYLGKKYQPLRISYLQLPLGLRLNLTQKFSLHAGPQLATKVWFHEQSGNYKYLELSGFGGLSFMLTDYFFIEARYVLGFTEVYTDSASVSVLSTVIDENDETQFAIQNNLENLMGRNAYLQFTIGYRM